MEKKFFSAERYGCQLAYVKCVILKTSSFNLPTRHFSRSKKSYKLSKQFSGCILII